MRKKAKREGLGFSPGVGGGAIFCFGENGRSGSAETIQEKSILAIDHFSEPVSRRNESPQLKFEELLWRWRIEVKHTSSVSTMVLNDSYQQIVGLGKPAIPLILRELEREPDHLFHALKAITGENPVKEENFGDLDAMTKDWLNWGKSEGIL